jgi:hypothetical protein
MDAQLARSKIGATFHTGALLTGTGSTAAAAAQARSGDVKGKGKAAVVSEEVEDMGAAPGVSGPLPRGSASKDMQGGEEEGSDEEELRPVDVDVNLVQSLLASYAGQQGLPGPVSNLAGLMGISLPDEKDSHGKSPFDAFMS